MASISSTYLKLITSSSSRITQHNSYRFAYARRYNDNHNDPSLFLSPRQSRCRLSSWSPVSRTSAAPPRAAVVAADTLVRDAGATALVISGAYAFVTAVDNLARRGTIPQSLSRKLVHILSGLLFMASWPLFRELLRGPLYYVLMLALCAVVFWRESPIGVISLSMMCGGDGIADIMGRKFGHVKLPYNQDKSWVGSISMFAFGFLISIGMLYYFSALGYFKLDWVVAVKKVALVSLVATAIESLPITKLIDDNIAVPIGTMIMAYFCFCL